MEEIKKDADGVRRRIKELRYDLGLSQALFGDRLGYSDPYVSQVESGRRTLNKKYVLAISREFDVSEKWLLEGTGNKYLLDHATRDGFDLSAVSNEDLLAEVKRRIEFFE